MTWLLLDGLRARRRVLVGALLGLVALAVGYLSLFPQLEEQLQAFAGDLPEFYTALIGDADFSRPEGYVRSQVYALVAPFLASGLAIAAGAGLARSERDVTLTTTYAAPVSRRALALAQLGVAWSVALVSGVAVVVGVQLGAPLAGADVGLSGIIAATVPLVGLAGLSGTVAWAVGAATGAPGAATGAGWGLLGLAFVSNSIGELVTDLGWLSNVSPWSWYGAGAPITDGFDPVSLLLFALAALVAVVGVVAFQRRDLQL